MAGWPWTDAYRKEALAAHIIDLTYVELGIHEDLVAYVADQQNTAESRYHVRVWKAQPVHGRPVREHLQQASPDVLREMRRAGERHMHADGKPRSVQKIADVLGVRRASQYRALDEC